MGQAMQEKRSVTRRPEGQGGVMSASVSRNERPKNLYDKQRALGRQQGIHATVFFEKGKYGLSRLVDVT